MSHRLNALILGMVLLSGCAGVPRGGSLTAGPAAGLVPFPTDRVVSAETEYTHTGIETASRSPGASELGPRLELTSGPGTMEWATYVFVPSGNYPLSTGTVTLGAPGSLGVYVGAADFTAMRWEFSGPYLGVAAVPLTADNLSPLGNVYLAVVVNDGGVAKIDEVKISETTPDPPVASLTTLTPKVNPLQSVDFDAAGSTTPNGTITDYEWDLDGNGVFNEAGVEQSFQGSSNADLTFGPQPAAIDVSVRVTDSLALQDVATITVTAIGWLVVNIDPGSGAGDVVSLAAINGKPAMAYASLLPQGLVYAYSAVNDGSSSWSTLLLDGSTAVGDCTLAEINGFPAVAYQQSSLHNLIYAYTSAPDGSSGWNLLPLSMSGFIEPYCGLAEIGGKPAVACYAATGGSNGQVEYYYSSMDDGSSGWVQSVVDDGEACGYGCTLANVGDTPAVAYVHFFLGFYYLNYNRNSQADGMGTWTREEITNEASLFGNLNLVQLASGNPALTYKGFNNSLYYARSSAPTGGTWSRGAILGANSGSANSLGILNGRPAVSTQFSDFSLYFGRPETEDGSGSWTFNAVNSELVNASQTSFAEINGRAAIAYRASSGGLFYATLFE